MHPTIGQFFLVLMVFPAHVVIGSLTGNYTDRQSLLEFRKNIGDPQQALTSWNSNIHFCSWVGVQCSTKHPYRVTSLHITSKGLVGPISPSLGNLTFLKVLNLWANSFTGEIPSSLNDLSRLQILNLNNNTLKGRIPSLANCSKLMELRLYNNRQLYGHIPADLPNGLRKLELGNNNLTGSIPASLANITTLNKFSCVNNNITGNIPNEFAKLSGMRYLYVGLNKLSGPFPQPILNLSNLIEFSAADNDLSGGVPSIIGNSLPNLQLFELGGNFFHGLIPSTLTNASKLFEVDIAFNKFTGAIPSSFGKLSRLSWLNFELNELQARNKKDWEFMNSLANCTELQILSLGGNRLQGNVPNSLGNLSSQVQYVYLTGNELTGDFPSGIANLPNLIIVAMHLNQFTGVIPEWIGTLKSLQQLRLENNHFRGLIPSTISNLSNLMGLTLESNQLHGHIPQSLGDFQRLEVLSISGNNLYGNVPVEIFMIPTIMEISLSLNNLHGELPLNIGNAKQLMYLHLSSNNMSGDIPSNMGNCETLEEINLSNNVFRGHIPNSLGNINMLNVLNLSHNNLTGSIPLSLGNLQLLEQLDLSFNHLNGVVPTTGIFANVSAIHINGNEGLCGGVQELQLLTCFVTPLKSRRHKNLSAEKVVIPSACMALLLAVFIYILFHWKGKQKMNSMSLPSFGGKFPKVSYSDLAKATEGFSMSNLIGNGTYSSVYQGKLFQDSIMVAVKVFTLETKGAQKSFIAECNALRNVRHRNLVPILTACSSVDSKGNDFKALVYEYMARGDLHALLYPTQADANPSTSRRVTLAQRLSILVDVADALEYLHHNNHGTIVHCDIKPSNILLDDNMTAHVGDFGLSRFKVDSAMSRIDDSISTSSVAIKGTIGYVAPEYAVGGQVSTAGDFYSFGVVLLEIFLRKTPTDDMFTEGLNIANFVEANFPDKIPQIIDPELLEELQDFSQESLSFSVNEKILDCLLSIISIGLRCTKVSPNERMEMREVAARLHRINEAYLNGK